MMRLGAGELVGIGVAVVIISIALFLPIATAGENLTFSGVPPTLIPATYGQHWANISEGDHNWVTIANVVPRPFVDYFGVNSELGWQVFFLILIGTMFIVMFGRQANVILPLLTFMIIGSFGLALIPDSTEKWLYTLTAAAGMGVIIFIARRKH